MPLSPSTVLGPDGEVVQADDLFSGNVDWAAWQNAPPSSVPITPDGGLNPALIPDGFSYNVRLKYLPYRSFPMFLRLLDDYRRQAVVSPVWQPRWYPVPQTPGVQVEAGDQFYYEQRMAAGSVIWGYSFYVQEAEGVSIGNIRVSLKDVGANVDITAGAADNKFVPASYFRPNFTGTGPGNGFNVVLASEPYELRKDPRVAVTLVNLGAADATAQLLILVLEPGGSPQ